MLWATDPFIFAREDRLGFPDEIAIAIAEQIRMELAPEVRAAIEHRRTQNEKGWDLYQKGMQTWDQLSRDSIGEAFNYFEEATKLDPTYALAWAGKVHTLVTSPRTVGRSRSEIAAEAEAALV